MNKQLKPSFYDDFKCIADKCESNCCSEKWSIFIDKKTYKRYMDFSGEIRKDLKKNIKINPNRKSTSDYAKIKLNNEGFCSLLSQDGLCKIHSSLGAQELSYVCKIYPREIVKVGNLYEYKLTISCPEVARKALLNKEKFSFVIDEERVNKIDDYYIRRINMTEEYFQVFWEIRSFAIEIIQMRSIELWKRIMLLGLFCKEVDKHLNDLDKVINEIEKYRIMVNNKEVLNSIENIKINNEKKLNLITQFIRSRVDYRVYNKDFIEICNDLDIVVGFSEESSKEEIMRKYEELEGEVYKKFLIDNSYVLENYLVNAIYKQFVFWYETKSFYDRFVKIVIQYSIVRFLLMGQIARKKDKFNEKNLIKVFYSFSRVIEHSPIFIEDLILGLKQKGYDELNYMSILIRE
ncbi:MAG: flagellin lysine-N-methylase [Clostridium septicum]|uniref:flagellin lysine-N-methylase n=1 Tax=Clostridium septicum TaxID=1504 RepID=UPI00258CB286|nr:flagellin lysine-N-methylase [Clostridium septicum]MDU1313953.1 flagellin lysine-N-methylase [Clostridium septicum]